VPNIDFVVCDVYFGKVKERALIYSNYRSIEIILDIDKYI